MQAWEKFLSLQSAELGDETVDKWLRTLKILRFDACNIYLQANDTFQVTWFEEHIRAKARASLRNNNNKCIKVHLSVNSHHEPQTEKTKKNSKKAKTKENVTEPPKFGIPFDDLDPLCTFENYIGSDTNPVPHKLLYQIVGYRENAKTLSPMKNELALFNPIYLCGTSGTGKTHLLMATAQALRTHGLSVIYVRAETFTEHVISAIRAGEMSLFRNSYRNIDVLLIDDVHLFAKKWATQEEFFHTFNTLHLGGKQVILSANCLPGELQFIEPRLISRFEWGIVLPLEVNVKTDIIKILHAKAKALQFEIPAKLAEFLVDTFPSSTKAVTRALEALILRTHLSESGGQLSPTQLTIPFVQKQLADLIQEEQKSAVNPTKIIKHVSEFFGILPEDVVGKAQSRDCVLPRQIAMYLCRAELKMPFTKIGDIFAKDHSTVMSSVKLIQKGLDNNESDLITPWHTILKKLKT